MSNYPQPFKGHKFLKMDPKFRISIQSAWRPDSGEPLFLLLSKKHNLPVVKVLSQTEYNERVNIVRASDLPPAQKALRLDKLAMLCRETTLNEQGKLLIPKDLSEAIGIPPEGEVGLAGRGLYFEVWSKANFDAMFEIESRMDDDDLGIF